MGGTTVVLVGVLLSVCFGSRVCIVGAGIAGASCAYSLRNVSDVELVVVERSSRAGGRLFSVVVDGVVVDVGGDAWTSANHNMMRLIHELPIELDTSNFVGNGKTAVFDGVTLRPAMVWEPVTEARVAVELEVLKARIFENFLATRGGFSSVDEYVKVGLSHYLGESAREWAEKAGLNSFFVESQFEPLSRVIYDQSLNATLFAGLVSLLSTQRSFAAKGGNDSIVKKLLKKSGAQVLFGSSVASIANGTLMDANGNAVVSECDGIVLAAPIEMSGIRNDWMGGLGRVYHHWWITMVAADAFQPSFFGLSNNSVVPDSILTTQNSSSPFVACSVLEKGKTRSVYKCFSNQNILSLVPQLFANVSQCDVHFFPHTFPEMVPNVKYQPIVLQPGNIVYTGAIESIAVAMEEGVISGYNAGTLIRKILSLK